MLRGTGVEKGQGKVPSTSAAQTTGKGRGGGGDAPLGPVPHPGPASTVPADSQPRTTQYPLDRFGCFIIPPGFNMAGYSFADWQRYWRVPEACITHALAFEAGQREALQQPGARLTPRQRSQEPQPTWECGFCHGAMTMDHLYCGRAGHTGRRW